MFEIISNEVSYNKFISSPWIRGNDCIYFFDRFDLFYSDKIIDMILSSRQYCSILDLKNIIRLSIKTKEFDLVSIRRPDIMRWEIKSEILFRRQKGSV